MGWGIRRWPRRRPRPPCRCAPTSSSGSGCARRGRSSRASTDRSCTWRSRSTPTTVCGTARSSSGWRELPKPGLVYVTTRKEAERYAELLAAAAPDVRAAHHHAGLRPARRDELHDAFLASGLDVVVATSGFGMGIDKPDVRCVPHAAAPGSLARTSSRSGAPDATGSPRRSSCTTITTTCACSGSSSPAGRGRTRCGPCSTPWRTARSPAPSSANARGCPGSGARPR
ncbi:helicase-related protein [Pseudonocardia benzenivorans]